MSKKPEPWHLWVFGIYTMIVLWFLTWTGMAGAKDWCVFVPAVSEANCASWVQAWGSILALVIGVLVVWWQMSKQRRQLEEDEICRLEVMSAASVQVGSVALRLCGLIKKNEHPMAVYAHMDIAQLHIRGLASIPPHEIPSWEVAAALVKLSVQADTFAVMLRDRREKLPDNPDFDQQIADVMLLATFQLINAIDKALVARGAVTPAEVARVARNISNTKLMAAARARPVRPEAIFEDG